MMKKRIEEVLLSKDWSIDCRNENDAYNNVLNGLPVHITLYEKSMRYNLKGFVDMVIPYDDIVRIEDDCLILSMATVLIG